MPETIAEVLWWFLTGALGIISIFLMGFINYLLRQWDADMKEMKKNVSDILINTSVIPSLLADNKAHAAEITELKLKVVRLENGKS